MKPTFNSNSNIQSKLEKINFYGIDFQMRYKKKNNLYILYRNYI